MIFEEAERNDMIRQQRLDVQIKMNNKNEKTLIANVPSESADTHFGKIKINARLQVQQRVKSDQKKEKFEMQTLKMQIESSTKKSKIFNISLAVNRGVKKSADSKLHFLLQVTDNKALMTIIDDYTECGMKIRNKAPEISVSEAVQLQRRRLDKRRKGSVEGLPIQDHNDPDFKGEQDEENH